MDADEITTHWPKQPAVEQIVKSNFVDYGQRPARTFPGLGEGLFCEAFDGVRTGRAAYRVDLVQLIDASANSITVSFSYIYRSPTQRQCLDAGVLELFFDRRPARKLVQFCSEAAHVLTARTRAGSGDWLLLDRRQHRLCRVNQAPAEEKASTGAGSAASKTTTTTSEPAEYRFFSASDAASPWTLPPARVTLAPTAWVQKNGAFEHAHTFALVPREHFAGGQANNDAASGGSSSSSSSGNSSGDGSGTGSDAGSECGGAGAETADQTPLQTRQGTPAAARRASSSSSTLPAEGLIAVFATDRGIFGDKHQLIFLHPNTGHTVRTVNVSRLPGLQRSSGEPRQDSFTACIAQGRLHVVVAEPSGTPAVTICDMSGALVRSVPGYHLHQTLPTLIAVDQRDHILLCQPGSSERIEQHYQRLNTWATIDVLTTPQHLLLDRSGRLVTLAYRRHPITQCQLDLTVNVYA